MEGELAFSIPRNWVIPYEPEVLRSFNIYLLRYIDNLHFLADPSTFTNSDSAPYIAIAHELFIDTGWEGDGDIQLLWLPSFVFPRQLGISPEGIVLWHVKQDEDGVSFLLSPIELPFEKFRQSVSTEFS
jgi:hypothetical protein